MRPTDHLRYSSEDYFLLRTPLLPVETLFNLGKGLTSADTCLKSEGEFERAFENDCLLARHRLAECIEDPEFREALAISSESLFKQLGRMGESVKTKQELGIEASVLKYLVRASSRCTPFGLMAGVALGDISDERSTELVLKKRTEHKRHVRADSHLLVGMAAILASDKSVAQKLRYHPNSTLYRIGEHYRYYEGVGHPYSGMRRLVSVEVSDPVNVVLKKARVGVTRAELIATIKKRSD